MLIVRLTLPSLAGAGAEAELGNNSSHCYHCWVFLYKGWNPSLAWLTEYISSTRWATNTRKAESTFLKTLYENTHCIPTTTPTNISSVYHQNQGDIYVISIESFFLDGFLNVSAVITFGQPKPNSSSNWTQLDLSWAKVASKTADFYPLLM